MSGNVELKSASFELFQQKHNSEQDLERELADRIAKLNAGIGGDGEEVPQEIYPVVPEKQTEDDERRSVASAGSCRSDVSRQSVRSAGSQVPKLPKISSGSSRPPSQNRRALQKLRYNAPSRGRVNPEALGHIVDRNHLGTARQWLGAADPEHQNVVSAMFKDVDRQYLRHTLERTLKPEASRYVERWIDNVGQKERNAVLDFFSYMADEDRKTQEADLGGLGLGGKSERMRKKRLAEQQALQNMPNVYWPPPPANGHTLGFFARPSPRWRRSFLIHPEWVP